MMNILFINQILKKHNKKYHTPHMVHEKWQVDVKYVPLECKTNDLEGKFYQYKVLDEFSRKRALYFSNEHSMFETVNAFKYTHNMIGSYPKEIQTDNGVEFTDKVRRKENGKTSRNYPNYLEKFLSEINVAHHLIRPRTPEHNGKVERSHRIDQDRFYKILKFYSLKDLKLQGLAWNKDITTHLKLCLDLRHQMRLNLKS